VCCVAGARARFVAGLSGCGCGGDRRNINCLSTPILLLPSFTLLGDRQTPPVCFVVVVMLFSISIGGRLIVRKGIFVVVVVRVVDWIGLGAGNASGPGSCCSRRRVFPLLFFFMLSTSPPPASASILFVNGGVDFGGDGHLFSASAQNSDLEERKKKKEIMIMVILLNKKSRCPLLV
jgi:hypothetical protein